MSVEEQVRRGSDRCVVHPSAAAIARCDVCGRAMCLACAVPVRGVAVGTECLATVLGPDAPPPTVPEREPGALARTLARVAFAVAVAATLLPWSRFGAGAGPLGAWSDHPRWSMLAALAAVAGLAVTLAPPSARSPSRPWGGASLALSGLVVLGAALAILRPPAFTSPWIGPWVALVAGALALAAAVATLRDARQRNASSV